MPRTTRAIRIERIGPPETLVEREVPLGDPGAGEVHLKVLASGVNFADLLMRAGLYGTVPPRPYSPGFEVAGVVERTGPGVRDWRPGERVVALLRHGGYAHDVVVPARNLLRCPDSLTLEAAAALPVVFLTASVCLFEAARSRPAETALILNAGGGVGTALVQLAVRHGMRVIGTAGSERKRTFVVDELGAEACLDSTGGWEAGVERALGPRGVDVALDPLGGRATAACRRLLAPLGRIVFYGLSTALPGRRRAWPRAALAWLRTPLIHPLSLVESNAGIFGVHLLHLENREFVLLRAMPAIFEGITSGDLRPVLDRTFPFDRDGAIAAHRYLHARANVGKVVLARSPAAQPATEASQAP
jgi:NADPH:quinone reductase-like Zn-dependent oxidoreductase